MFLIPQAIDVTAPAPTIVPTTPPVTVSTITFFQLTFPSVLYASVNRPLTHPYPAPTAAPIAYKIKNDININRNAKTQKTINNILITIF